MSPTIFRYRNYRFFFFSREELRMHVHVFSSDGEAKIWIEPDIEVAIKKGLNNAEINHILHIVKERENEIRKSWHKHFPS